MEICNMGVDDYDVTYGSDIEITRCQLAIWPRMR